jgi:hypothetical protein
VSKLAYALLLLPLAGLSQPQTIEIDGETFRDPTQPPWTIATARQSDAVMTPAGVTIDSLSLSFVRVGGLSPIAVINDTQVTVGDVIEGFQVLDIRAGEVVLMISGEEQVLSRFARPVKTPVDN